jgi:hypothetical protein
MTLAGERLSAFAGWLDASSAPRLSPCGHKRRAPRRGFLGLLKPVVHGNADMVRKGRYAELLPWDFAEPFDGDFAEHSLPLLISFDQCAGLNLPDDADLSLPAGQGRAFERLAHIIGKMEDAAKAHLSPWRAEDGWRDRLCIIVGLSCPDTPIADQIAAQVPPGVDLTAYAVLACPTFKFSRKERVAIGHRLPFIP